MRSRSLSCTPRPLTRAVRAAVIALPLSVLAAPPASAAETDARRYEIPAGPLSSALSRFAGDTGVLLSVDASLVQGLASDGLQGEYAVEQGFAALLRGSGLRAVRDAQGNYSLVAESAPVELQTLHVQGSLGNALGSMEGYNATHSSVATKTPNHGYVIMTTN